MIIRAKLDLKKVPEDCVYKGQKGDYIDITLLENKNGPDQYGNDFMVVLDVGKVRREAGEKGPIIGNAKYAGQKPAGATPASQQSSQPYSRGGAAPVAAPAPEAPGDEIPY